MRSPARLQLLACLMLYASSAHAIMVKYGTKDGPIVPPTPEPTTLPQPYRNPAPVWEERSDDTPDPNAQWRPPLFVPQPRYTQVVYSPPPSIPSTTAVPLTNVQRFVNAYVPVQPSSMHNDSPAILSSQTLPGIGLRYFFPAYGSIQRPSRQDDAHFNHVENDGQFGIADSDSNSDFQWKYEKDATRRNTRNSLDLLTYLMQHASNIHSILVNFQPKEDSTVSPISNALESPNSQLSRNPALTWDNRLHDAHLPIPATNTQWQIFKPKYTQEVYSSPPTTPSTIPVMNCNSELYIPTTTSCSPSKLSSQSLVGRGFQYAFPVNVKAQEYSRQRSAKLNHSENNGQLRIAGSDPTNGFQEEYESNDIETRSNTREPQDVAITPPILYRMPGFIPEGREYVLQQYRRLDG